MSNKKDNQELINRTKQYLQEYGYDVKTSHLYEVFAKLADEPNWHVANAKGKNLLSTVMNKLNINRATFKNEQELLKEIKELLKKGKLKDNFLYGFDGDNNPVIESPSKYPNSMFVGDMGSGKTTALRFALFFHMLANSENTIYIFNNPYQGLRDFYNLPEKATKFFVEDDGTFTKSNEMIDALYNELKARKDLLEQNNIKSLAQYNQEKSQKLSKIVLVIENFHYYFGDRSKTMDYPGDKLKAIMKDGRDCGIFVMGEIYVRAGAELPADVKSMTYINIDCNFNKSDKFLFHGGSRGQKTISMHVVLLHKTDLRISKYEELDEKVFNLFKEELDHMKTCPNITLTLDLDKLKK